MKAERLYRILKAPLTTEKSVRVGDKNRQFVFRVARDATKPEIKQAVEKLFSVVVKAVQVVNIAGKQKRFKDRAGKRSNHRKAYVSLEAGHDINLANFE